jgi:leucyl aminopeptidase
VERGVAWAHLDIAGPAWDDKAGGATGFGVATLYGLAAGGVPAKEKKA